MKTKRSGLTQDKNTGRYFSSSLKLLVYFFHINPLIATVKIRCL